MYEFRGKDLISVILTLPVIVPPLCVAMGLHLWFIKIGLASTFSGVVLVHLTFCLPYSVFVLWGVFSNYNPDYEEQARSLGASSWNVIFRVMLPLTFPGIMVAGLFSFLLSWSQYLSTLIIGGGRVTTLPILLFALMGSGDRSVAAAVSIVFVVPAFLALLFSARLEQSRRSIKYHLISIRERPWGWLVRVDAVNPPQVGQLFSFTAQHPVEFIIKIKSLPISEEANCGSCAAICK